AVHKAGNTTFKVHLDVYAFLPYLKGGEEKSSGLEYFYFSDAGDLMAMRYDHWKLVFLEQRVVGTLGSMRAPASFNITNVRGQILEAIKAAHGGNGLRRQLVTGHAGRSHRAGRPTALQPHPPRA